MNSDWTTGRLGDVCTKIGSGATPRGGESVYTNSGTALIRSQNVVNGEFRFGGLAYIGSTHAEQLSGVTVQEGDVLLNITGDSVARSCRVPPDVLPARVNQHVAIIRPDQTRLDARFLQYVLISPSMQAHLLGLAAAGATRRALTKSMIEDLSVPLPRFDEQRRIAGVLGGLDDKIEHNRRLANRLAQAENCFYRRAISSETQAARLGDLIELRYGKGLPERARRPGRVEVFGSNGPVGYHDEALVSGPGIVVGRKGNPGIVRWAHRDFFPIDTTFYVVPKPDAPSLLFLLHALLSIDFSPLNADSAVPGLNRSLALDMSTPVPSDQALSEFETAASPLSDLQRLLATESHTLKGVRNTLLPRLVVGQIRVPESYEP